MSRSTPYRRVVSDCVSLHQDEALEATIFILREIGPTGFLLQEEGDPKKYKVLLGDVHSCTCQTFRKENDLCRHLCWVLLKKFRIGRQDPLSWQLGFVEREINGLLCKKASAAPPSSDQTAAAAVVVEVDDCGGGGEGPPPGRGIVQRPIADDDVCPICQDELLESRLPVTFCRQGCGNNVHIRCMKVWSDHQKKQKAIGPNDFVSCPFCRGDFAQWSLLMREVAQTHLLTGPQTRGGGRDCAVHLGTECGQCRTRPIAGKVYKCNKCTNFLLCAACFNAPIHTQHAFIFRERSNARWQPAPSSRALPGALITSLQSRELSDGDYDLLLQLDAPAPGSDLRQSDINRLPSWHVKESSRLLAPGQQCRLCLMAYRTGEPVRQLPDCSHIFHAACLDPWLLHRTATCPLDSVAVAAPPPARSSAPVTDDSGQMARRASVGAKNEKNIIPCITNFSLNGTGFHNNNPSGSDEGSGGPVDLQSVTSSQQQPPPRGNSSGSFRLPRQRPRTLPPIPVRVAPLGAAGDLNVAAAGPVGNSPPPVSAPVAGRKNRDAAKQRKDSHQIQPSVPSIARENHNVSLRIGEGGTSPLGSAPPSQQRGRPPRNPGYSFGQPPRQSRARSASASRKEKEREKAYANDPRLQEAIRKLELYAHSYNINLEDV